MNQDDIISTSLIVVGIIIIILGIVSIFYALTVNENYQQLYRKYCNDTYGEDFELKNSDINDNIKICWSISHGKLIEYYIDTKKIIK